MWLYVEYANMAELKSTRLEKQQLDAIEDMAEREIADNESEAHRMLLNAGMHEYGYQNGDYTETVLKQGLEKVSWLLMLGGIVGLAFTVWYPVTARIPSFSVLVVGFVLWRVALLVESREPDLSNRLKSLFGGETA